MTMGPGVRGAAPFILAGGLALVVRAVLARSTRRSAAVWRDVLLMVPLVLLYFLARGAAAARPAEAVAHAERVIALERALGVFRERAFQRLVLGSDALVDVANWTYVFGHWPVIAATFVWLAVAHRDRLRRYRDAMIISGVVGILIFLTYPVAPPRLMEGYGFVDTVLLRSRAYRVLQPAALTDLYASVPSLHVGWNVVMGIALARESSHGALRAFGLAMPIAMAAAVVLTANHYILDVALGVALVLASLRIADALADRAAAGHGSVEH
jgi:hypothetical protein